MNVVITGGAGFLGTRLAQALLRRGTLAGASGEQQRIDRIVLLDVVPASRVDDLRIEAVAGDIADPSLVDAVIGNHVSSVFHLAAVVSGEAERNFDLGMRVNIDAARTVLEACRRNSGCPRVVFTSSVAVYGGELPDVVTDSTALDPRSSYGVQKAIGELMLADYTRKKFVDGRVGRLPTISVRPGRPNQAASSFASGIIREPLNGEEAVCPVSKDMRLWLLSPRRAIECLIGLHDLSNDAVGNKRSVNLPGLSVSVTQMVDALCAVGGERAADHIRWQRDEAIERIVGSWPTSWDTSRASALGFAADANFETVVRDYVQDNLH